MKQVRQLTEKEVQELKVLLSTPNGDEAFWKRMKEIYSDDEETSKRAEFELKYLLSVKAIPYEFNSHWKTEQAYLETVKDFYDIVGYPAEKEKQYEDCLLEKIAEKFGIDIDINGDGVTSFEKYRDRA